MQTCLTQTKDPVMSGYGSLSKQRTQEEVVFLSLCRMPISVYFPWWSSSARANEHISSPPSKKNSTLGSALDVPSLLDLATSLTENNRASSEPKALRKLYSNKKDGEKVISKNKIPDK